MTVALCRRKAEAELAALQADYDKLVGHAQFQHKEIDFLKKRERKLHHVEKQLNLTVQQATAQLEDWAKQPTPTAEVLGTRLEGGS